MSIPTRPYLIRAFYDWIVDNNWTPHIVVLSDMLDLEITQEQDNAGQIILNISSDAVKDLILNNDYIDFKGRFNGLSKHVMVPVESIVAIYAKENGRGMVFADEDHDDDGSEEEIEEMDQNKKRSSSKGKKKSRSHLTVVK